MAVIRVWEKFAAKSGDDDAEGNRSYTRVLGVETNNPRDGKRIVCLHPLIPQYGSYYATLTESDDQAMLTKRSADQDGESDYIWEITCNFSTKAGDSEEENENPLARPPKHSWSGATRETHPLKDLNGKIFQNSAFWRFSPAIGIPTTDGVLKIVRNEAVFDEARAEEFSNVLNENAWRGRRAGTVKCLPPSGDECFEKGIHYVKVTYTFHIRREGWPETEEEVLDEGPFELKLNADGNPVGDKVHEDADGVSHTEMIALDGKGKALSLAKRQAGQFETIRFKKYHRKNLGALGLS